MIPCLNLLRDTCRLSKEDPFFEGTINRKVFLMLPFGTSFMVCLENPRPHRHKPANRISTAIKVKKKIVFLDEFGLCYVLGD